MILLFPIHDSGKTTRVQTVKTGKSREVGDDYLLVVKICQDVRSRLSLLARPKRNTLLKPQSLTSEPDSCVVVQDTVEFTHRFVASIRNRISVAVRRFSDLCSIEPKLLQMRSDSIQKFS